MGAKKKKKKKKQEARGTKNLVRKGYLTSFASFPCDSWNNTSDPSAKLTPEASWLLPSQQKRGFLWPDKL